MMKLKLAGIKRDSIVDGPGLRVSVFVQGCPHCCPGCQNPETHDPEGGYTIDVEDVAAEIGAARGIDGVTFSGGEPFEQTQALAYLARKCRKMGLSLVYYSGYTFEQLLQKGRSNRHILTLLQQGQFLIDGPFELGLRDISLAYRGSSNQRIIELEPSLALNKAICREF